MLKTAIASVCMVATLAIGGLTGEEPPSKQEENVREHINLDAFKPFLGLRDHNTHRVEFTLGDSLHSRQLADAERLDRLQRQNRDTSPRESTRGTSYTGRGNAEVIGESREQCVEYAKRITGINRSLGYAGRIPSQGDNPEVGAIGLEKGYGHAVVIEKIEGDKITITEANWYRGKITRRVLSKLDFRGFVYS